MNYFLFAFILLIASIITATVCKNKIYFTFSFFFGFCVLIVMITVLCFCCFKHHLVIEPVQHKNPVKVVWKVMKYASLTNNYYKQLLRHSAYTYGKLPPSRLDLCKERYGGQFTTV